MTMERITGIRLLSGELQDQGQYVFEVNNNPRKSFRGDIVGCNTEGAVYVVRRRRGERVLNVLGLATEWIYLYKQHSN